MKRALCLICCVCMVLGLAGCGDDGTGKGFRFPLLGEPKQLDPQVATDKASATLVSVLFEGLTQLDDSGRAVPGAADWTVSADGLTYTFTLRESYWSTLTLRGVETGFEQPQPVTAADFLFGLQRALDPATGSTLGKSLYAIKNAKAVHTGKKGMATLGVKAVDDRILTITLAKADDSFPATLAVAPCMPCNREFFEYTAGRYGLERQYVLSNGPFSLTAWNHDQSLLLHKNEGYHGAAEIAPSAVRFVMDEEVPADGLLTGTMDAAPLTADRVAAMAADGVQTVQLQDTLRQLWFNAGRQPLSNANLRRALRDSVEWDTVYDYLTGAGETPAAGYVPPAAMLHDGTAYRSEDNQQLFATNAKAARTALGKAVEALYPEGGSLPRLTLLAADDEVTANVARYLVQSWQKHLHLSVSLQLVAENQVTAALAGGYYDMALHIGTPTGLTGGENLAAFATDAPGNYAGLADKTTDAAIAAALSGGRADLEALEARLRDICPALPLSFPTRYYGIAADCEGIAVLPFDGGRYGCPYDFHQAKKWD